MRLCKKQWDEIPPERAAQNLTKKITPKSKNSRKPRFFTDFTDNNKNKNTTQPAEILIFLPILPI